jgi:tetratricopeptide (TPR) repeat protein
MRALLTFTCGLMVSMILANASPAFAAGGDILSRLKSKDSAARARAALELGETGTMTQTPALAVLLKDSNPGVRQVANASLWKIWTRSGDPEIDTLMEQGVLLMQSGNLSAAIKAFSEMIARNPGFAEGWNKRATALYLAKRFDESIADCNKTVELNPHHFGALFGLGLNYVGMEDFDRAIEAFHRTLKVAPYSRPAQSYIDALQQKIGESRKKI